MMSGVVYIWDLPLRLFHWLLVLSLVVSYVTGTLSGLWLDWHGRSGLLIISLVSFRIAWGFMGSTYARFENFFPTRERFKKYFRYGWSGAGHNPFGAMSVFSLLIVILLQAGTGLFAMEQDIEFYGPFNELVSNRASELLTGWHIQIVNLLVMLIVMHLSAIAYYKNFKQKNLVSAMLTGIVSIAGQHHVAPASGGGRVRCIVSIAIGGLVYWCIDSGVLISVFS